MRAYCVHTEEQFPSVSLLSVYTFRNERFDQSTYSDCEEIHIRTSVLCGCKGTRGGTRAICALPTYIVAKYATQKPVINVMVMSCKCHITL
jgi:hypothetical protein